MITLELDEDEALTVQAALGCYSHANLRAIHKLKTPYKAECEQEDARAIEVGQRLRALRDAAAHEILPCKYPESPCGGTLASCRCHQEEYPRERSRGPYGAEHNVGEHN